MTFYVDYKRSEPVGPWQHIKGARGERLSSYPNDLRRVVSDQALFFPSFPTLMHPKPTGFVDVSK